MTAAIAQVISIHNQTLLFGAGIYHRVPDRCHSLPPSPMDSFTTLPIQGTPALSNDSPNRSTVLQDPISARTASSVLPALQRVDALGDVFVVPGTVDQTVRLRFTWFDRESFFDNEAGVYQVDTQGFVNGIAPAQAGYAYAALSSPSRTTLFSSGNIPSSPQRRPSKGAIASPSTSSKTTPPNIGSATIRAI
jgi:hypothetical protein